MGGLALSSTGSLERLLKLLVRLPGIGEKSARRLAFFILQQPPSFAQELAEAILSCRMNLRPCPECGNLTEREICEICADPLRNRISLCVVETTEDLLVLEEHGIHQGIYHVLGGRVSPLDGEDIDPSSLDRLRRRVEELGVREIILALDPQVEGELTAQAVLSALSGLKVKISRLSYGLPLGGSISFADRATLHAAMESRTTIKDEP